MTCRFMRQAHDQGLAGLLRDLEEYVRERAPAQRVLAGEDLHVRWQEPYRVPSGSGILWGARPQSLPGGEVAKLVEDKDRKNITVVEAAEYLGLSRTRVQEMVNRGVLKADKFAGAVHIPREEVERIERETAP